MQRWKPLSRKLYDVVVREVNQLKERGIMRGLNPKEKRVFSQPIIVAKPRTKVVRITLDCRRVNKVIKTWTTAMNQLKRYWLNQILIINSFQCWIRRMDILTLLWTLS